MPFLSANAPFDPDLFVHDVIGIAAELKRGHDSAMHHHQKNQLLYAPSGCMRVSFHDQWFTLTPMQALIIPAGIEHRVTLMGSVAYRSLYFQAGLFNLDQTIITTAMTALLKEIIERIAFCPFERILHKDDPLVVLLGEEIQVSQMKNTHLRLPYDQRIRHILDHYMDKDRLPSLIQLADQCALHEKTLSRIFKRDTGLSYQQWGQQKRLIHAFEYLAEGQSIHQVADRLEFSSDSAFIVFFKLYTGTTPKQYVSYVLHKGK